MKPPVMVDDRRLYNRTERRMLKAGKRAEAKEHWHDRYVKASDEKRRKMIKRG